MARESNEHQVNQHQPKIEEGVINGNAGTQYIESPKHHQQSACRYIQVNVNPKRDISIEYFDADMKEKPSPLIQMAGEIAMNNVPDGFMNKTPVSLYNQFYGIVSMVQKLPAAILRGVAL